MNETQYKSIIPAVPGSMIIWYNHCHDSTQASPLLFWGWCFEPNDDTPSIIPFTISTSVGMATPFELPIRNFDEPDPRHETESCIIAFEIPGWGRISGDPSAVYGEYIHQVKGYDPDFLSPKSTRSIASHQTAQRSKPLTPLRPH